MTDNMPAVADITTTEGQPLNPVTTTITPDTAADTVPVPKAQLMQLICQKRELMSVLSASVDIIYMIQELFGGAMPTDATDIIFKVPKVLKAVKNNSGLLNSFGEKLDVLKTIAPRYLSAEMIAKIKLPAPHE